MLYVCLARRLRVRPASSKTRCYFTRALPASEHATCTVLSCPVLSWQNIAEAFEVRDTGMLSSAIYDTCAFLGEEREIIEGQQDGAFACRRRRCYRNSLLEFPAVMFIVLFAWHDSDVEPATDSAAETHSPKKAVSHSLTPSELASVFIQVAAADLMLNSLSMEVELCDCVLNLRPAMLSHKLMRLRVLLYNVASVLSDLRGSATSPQSRGNGNRPGRSREASAIICGDIFARILERVQTRLAELGESEHILQKALVLYVVRTA